MQATKAWKKKQNEKTWSKTNASFDVLRCMVVRLARACMTGTFYAQSQEYTAVFFR